MTKYLEGEKSKAKKKADEISVDAAECSRNEKIISEQKGEAEKDLAEAMPHLTKAM